MTALPRTTGSLALRLLSVVVAAVVMIAPLLSSPSRAAEGSESHAAGHASGTVNFPVSCSGEAQAQFNVSVTLLHHMTYPQAREGFQRVLALDPECAMGHWGVAMTLFQPLWPTRPGPEALRLGWQHVEAATRLPPPTDRERLFIAATEAFFREPAGTDYWQRIRRWEEASKTLYQAFPDDPDAACFYALAHLATAASNTISTEHADEAAAILLRVYERYPGHPGAMHYLVHANDVPGREHELLDITRGYDASAPFNPHALHMPTHIYTRLGDWDGVVKGNLRAAEAALAFPAGEHGEFVWDEFPHAIEYLVYAYLQQGADTAAAVQLKRLHETARLEPSFKTAFHLASTRVRYALERHDWPDAASIVPGEPKSVEWSRYAWAEAIMEFGQGLGNAHLGRIAAARKAATRIEELEAATRKSGEELFARNIQVLRLELNAWIAHAEGRTESSVALLTQAAELEASTPKAPVTPAPTIPADELLGDLFSEQARFADALASYQRSLVRYPERFNSLLGAAKSARALEDRPTARKYYEHLLKIADVGTRRPVLDEARNYVRQ